MGSNIYIANSQFGEKQLEISFALQNGARMIGLLDLKTRKRASSLRSENTTERLYHREILRLLKKGVIKVKNSKSDREFMVLEYELTNNFKQIIRHEN